MNGKSKRREFRSYHPKTPEEEGRGREGLGQDAKQIRKPILHCFSAGSAAWSGV
jgi:hypothetical protein